MVARATPRSLLLGLLLLAPAGPAAALPESSGWTSLESPEASPGTLLRAVEKAAPVLARDSDCAIFRKGVTVCARGDATDRELLMAEVQRTQDSIRAALGALGAEPREDGPELVIVFARAPGSGETCLSPSRGTVLVRRGREGRGRDPGPAPEMPAGSGGCNLFGEVGAAAKATAAFTVRKRGFRGVEGPGSLRQHLARRLAVSCFAEGAPPWLVEGLAAAAEMRSRSSDPAGPVEHVPGGFAGKSGALGALLDAKEIPPRADPLLARVVAVLLDRAPDRKALLGTLARIGSLDAAKAGLGAKFDALLLETVAVAPGAKTCTDDGWVRCPLCLGLGRTDVECPACKRAGTLVCLSCKGDGVCHNKFCKGGTIDWEKVVDRVNDCRMCVAGKAYCTACEGKGKVTCAGCRGKGRHRIACPACVAGRLPCGDCPPSFTADCPGCSGKGERPCPAHAGAPPAVCGECRGSAWKGCEKCFGLAKVYCPRCNGSGDEVTFYPGDKTIASAHQCNGCSARGWLPCDGCDKKGRLRCAACSGKGFTGPADCPVCSGAKTQYCPACSLR